MIADVLDKLDSQFGFDHQLFKTSKVAESTLMLPIDDFGTGYSSLAYMARLPVDVIKIDRAFINDLRDDDQDSISIVTLMISLAHALKRTVVAEGVETREQARLLRQLNCDQGQGYLFSKPLPEGDIERFLLASMTSNTG